MSEEVSFERSSIVRSTVARRCKEYFHRRLERTESLQRRWSVAVPLSDDKTPTDDNKEQDVCSDSSDSPFRYKSSSSELPSGNDSGNASDSSESPPFHFRTGSVSSETDTASSKTSSARCSFDVAMDNLRKEITSLIAQDNDLFRQLLSLNDSIAELRVQQEKNISLWNLDSDSEHESLESLSDTETSSTVSPASTLSSCSSSHHTDSSKNAPCWRGSPPSEPGRQRTRVSVCRAVAPSDGCPARQRTRSVLCLRCHGKGSAPLYRRRAASSMNLWLRPTGGEEFNSYDSGIHIHSDSDHEIFV